MKFFFSTIIALFIGINMVLAQSADPAVTGANFVPNQINTGQTSLLTISFANTGSTAIPVSSIELTISTAYNYYTSNGTTAPTGPGSAFFNWTHTVGSTGNSDIWKGKNKVIINAFDGGEVLLTVTGNIASNGFETTTIIVQPTDSLPKFNDSPTNNNLSPQLKINQGCPPVPILSATTKANLCPAITADLTTLQPSLVTGQTFEWHTVSTNPIAQNLVSSPTQVSASTYYLYVKDAFCYSPASSAVIVTINVCPSPDITISLGPLTKIPIAFQTSSIPVSVTNIGTAPTAGQITAIIRIPVGTSFGTFPSSNNGWTCSTSGITATCTSSDPIANSGTSTTTFSVMFIPAGIQVGNTLIIPEAVVSGGGEQSANTGNNTSNTITITNLLGTDLVPSFTFLSSTYTVNTSKILVININESGSAVSNGTPISVFIPYSTGFTYDFISNSTSVIVDSPTTIPVNNSNWAMTTKPAGILLTSTTVIPANSASRIAIKVTANTQGAEASITINITPNGGGDVRSINNIISLAQSVQN